MSELRNVQELLTTGTGTEGSLLIEKTIHAELIQEVEKNLLDRSLARTVVGPSQIKGTSYDFDLQVPNTGAIRVVAEGAAYPQDQAGYTSVNVRPLKYGVQIRITTEFQEDAKWNILGDQAETFGRRMAENETGLVITALDGAANTVAAGANVQPANFATALQFLEESDFECTDLIVGNEVMTDIRNTDTFVEAMKSGSDEVLRTGFKGVIFGARVHRVSSNAGMTKTSAYAIDRRQAYAIVEKRTYTTEGFRLAAHDTDAIVLSQRIAVVLLRSSAVCKITSS